MINKLTQFLENRDWLLADGATGSNLMERGLQGGYPPELWNLERPDIIRDHYRSFIDAGSDIVLTNSFGGTAPRLSLHGAESEVRAVNVAAATLLREEIAASGRDVIAAGSVGMLGDVAAPMPQALRTAYFSAQMQGLKDGGVDLVWIETMASLDEAEAALEAAARHDLPAVVTMSFDTKGRSMMGVKPSDFAQKIKQYAPAPIAYGGNCSAGLPDFLASMTEMGAQSPSDVIVMKANCGVPKVLPGDTQATYAGTPDLMAVYARFARDMGARVIGGCCGTKPEHVRAMRAALLDYQPRIRPNLETIESVLGTIDLHTKRSLFSDNAGPRGGGRRGRLTPSCDCH